MSQIYTAEVGTPLQKALVDNPEAQKQLCEVIDLAIAEDRKRVAKGIKKIISDEKYEASRQELDQAIEEEKDAIASRLYINIKLDGISKQIINLIQNK